MHISAQITTSTLSLLACTFLAALTNAKEPTTPLAQKARTWAQDSSDIKADTKVTYGTLPNGMRYLLMPNKQPPGRVSMRLHIAAGSLMERDDQRGVAHFLEHMVFNGSKNFPDASQLIPKMQRLGIEFGAHANAYTSFDETVYMLDLPNNEADTLKLGFDVMRDFGDGAFLRNEEIEKERGVILSEKTTRDSVRMRLMEKQFQTLLPEALLTKRFPIGTDEIIKTAPRKAFTDFYNQYYIPSRMTFIYVGDFNLGEAQKRIIKSFSSMENPAIPGKTPNLGTIPSGQGFQTFAMSDKELATTDISLLAIRPHQKKTDNKANRAAQLQESLANYMINRRFSILAKKENSPITGGNTYTQDLFNFVDILSISVNAKNHDWQSAIPIMEQELRKALQHGFTESEFREVKAEFINAYEQSVKSAVSRKTHDLASSLAQHIHANSVYSTPEDDLAILHENLKNITVESCHDTFKKLWDTKDITLTLTTRDKPQDADKTLRSLYQASQKIPVSAPEKIATASFAYTDFGKAGTIEKKQHIKEHDFTQIHFHNGCRCNIKKTDFEKSRVSVTTRIGAGKLTMPKDKPGLDIYASSIFGAGGLGKHSNHDLRSILAGRNAGIGFNIDDDAFLLHGNTTPEDLELQLQLLCAYLTDPGFRPEANRLFQAQIPAIYSNLEHTSAGPQTKFSSFLHGNDPRFSFPTQEQLHSYTSAHVKEWIMPEFKNGYLELSIIGDLNVEKTTSILSRTIGALPKRAANKPSYEQERIIENQPQGPQQKRYTFNSRVAPGTALVTWQGTAFNDKTIHEARRLNILSAILSNRLREEIREKLGEAYSPYSTFQSSSAFKNLGHIIAVSPGKAEQAERVGKLLVEIGAKLASEGITEDELKRSLEPTLSSLKTTLRQNDYWLHTVMAQSQEQPYRLNWASGRDADYTSITVAEINALAKKYLHSDKAIRIEIVPVAPANEEEKK